LFSQFSQFSLFFLFFFSLSLSLSRLCLTSNVMLL
jgi:hypothetical protein